MQISQPIKLIVDNEKKKIYLQVLSDHFCLAIISDIISNPKTAVDISKNTKIPISTVYRRLQFLQENKLLKITGGIGKDGKYFLYQSRIKGFSTIFNGKSLEITVTSNLNFTIL
mgnify:FL=1